MSELDPEVFQSRVALWTMQNGSLRRRGKRIAEFVPKIDLMETRRRLVEIRSRHGHDRNVAKAINRLLGELYVVREPKDRFHEARLINRIHRALNQVQQLIWPRSE